MANSLQRFTGPARRIHRSSLVPLSRPFSTESLVEYKSGEIGAVSGIPDEHLRRRVVIFSPARTATQQGSGKVGGWKINFMSTQKWENPLMAWTSTGDPYANVGDAGLSFDSEEAAKAFAEKHGWEYMVKKRHTLLLKNASEVERTWSPKMTSKIPSKSILKLVRSIRTPLSRNLCTPAATAETQTQKLERIADELLSLNKLERFDYSVLFRFKMGLNKYGPAVSGLDSSPAASSAGPGSGSADMKAAEKTAFDIKLEKFDAGVKIKIIKEVRSFTDLGLKEAKDLVEKAPVVVKKGVAKEEADSIVEKLKVLGATVVLE